jgi:nucleotide-binding universal stress UspA family protein
MFSKILVPLDGSQLAERALVSAYALSQSGQGEVLLLRVATPEKIFVPEVHMPGSHGILWPEQSIELCRNEAREYLETIRSFAPAGLKLSAKVMDDGVPEAINDLAAAERVDLIAISSHGYSGITRLALGSVAEKVLRSAPCPVLVVRSNRPLRRALIALDGSALSEQALEPGLALAAALHCEVTLLRGVPQIPRDDILRLEGIESGLGLRLEGEIEGEADAYLEGRIAARTSRVTDIQRIVSEEPAALAILRYAEIHAIDLIVMSTHGRSGLRRWVYGSVTEKVMRGAGCSMLIIRPPRHQLDG